MAKNALPVEFLFSCTIGLQPALRIPDAPQGGRAIVGVTGGTFEGPRLRGTFEGSGGDWVTARTDGSSKLDVRVTLRTDDGALILMTYTGIGLRREGESHIRTAPLFETGDERYRWLNTIQAVGIGASSPGPPPSVSYDVYAVL